MTDKELKKYIDEKIAEYSLTTCCTMVSIICEMIDICNARQRRHTIDTVKHWNECHNAIVKGEK